MAREKSTPEEQLLKLIEKGGEAGTTRFKRKRRLFLRLGNIKMLWLSILKKISWALARLKGGLKEPNLKVLNKIFLILSMALLAYSIMDFIFGRPDIGEVYARLHPVKEKKPPVKIKAPTQPFLHYLEMVRRRNIFSPIMLKEPERPELKKQRLQDMIKDLNLVGVSWGEEPMAMIEDKQEKKTYFLKKGDTINQFKIEDILTDRVILSFEGEKIELL